MRHLFFLLFITLTILSCIRINTGKSDIRERDYKGKIKEIYQDHQNHMAWTFVVQSKSSNFEIVANIWPRSWEYAQVGDSIIKPADTLMIIIKKNDSARREFFYKF